MPASAPSYRVSLRLYVVFSLLMAVSAAASGLLLLYLARPFITALGRRARRRPCSSSRAQASRGRSRRWRVCSSECVRGPHPGHRAEGGGALAAVARRQPAEGDRRARRARRRGRAAHPLDGSVRARQRHPRPPARGHAARVAGRRPAVVQRHGRDPARPSLERFRGVPILAPSGIFPRERGNAALEQVLEEAQSEKSVSQSEVAVETASAAPCRSR